MFTGIIQAIGQIVRLESQGGDARISVETATLDLGETHLGDSIAVNGVCLTVIAQGGRGLVADVSRETLDLTTLGGLKPGSRVNLEKALTLSTPLGGHLVSGHVDGIGHLVERRPDGRSLRLRVEFPKPLARYIAPKGSICLDGVSLTVNRVDGHHFELNIVPHTLRETIIGDYREGNAINIEVDLIARYLERLMLGNDKALPEDRINEAFLARHGFLASESE